MNRTLPYSLKIISQKERILHLSEQNLILAPRESRLSRHGNGVACRKILHQGVYEETKKLQLEGKLFDKGSVDSSIPVVEESVLLVEDLEEVVSDDEEQEDANDFEWEAGLKEMEDGRMDR